ncbi:hypothetical protein [Planococcus beigongshangi]|uniref:hypothetical protein n=1 Tax=Planococcus beigongshangi TaxID=2782536 RepID=UPI00193BCBD6|nr:hypothetical protein [Planococcus beigongshangi]
MLKSKGAMVVGSMIGIFILVYGTAILFRLLFESYLFDGGLPNLNYGLLALLCAIPFVLIAIVGKKDAATSYSVISAALLFSVLFVLIHLVLVVSAGPLDAAAIRRTLAVFPVTALLLVVVLYFTAGRENIV